MKHIGDIEKLATNVHSERILEAPKEDHEVIGQSRKGKFAENEYNKADDNKLG